MSGIPHNTKQNYLLIQTYEFLRWFNEQNPKVQNNILRRLLNFSDGHFGDIKRFEGLIELRWTNGIRIYGFIQENRFFIILIGGNKNGQKWDIRKANKIKAEIINGTRSIKSSDPER